MAAPVFITGSGIVSAIGKDKSGVLASLKGKRSGISGIRYLDTIYRDLPAGEVKMSDLEMKLGLGISEDTIATRTGLMGIWALKEALSEAGIQDVARMDMTLISGTTVGGMEKTERYYRRFGTDTSIDGYLAVHDCGSTTGMIASYFGGFSCISTISTACSSAANAIIRGADMIRNGECDIVAAGGCECLSLFHLNGFNSLMILDEKPCRPFDASRQGLNLGEGAAFLILESERSVKARGVFPAAVVSGYGNRCDAYHQTASSDEGEGAFLAMRDALADAGLEPSEIDYVNAHGTGTKNNDASESAAIKKIFGSSIPPVSSTKPFTGHTTSASGSIEAVICILAIQNGLIPANLNWSGNAPDTIIPYTGDCAGHDIRHVLCNSFGFGGNDSSILLSKA